MLFLAVADDADAVAGDACCYEGGLGGVGAVLAEGDVVLSRATIVAVATDEDLDAGVCVEVGSGAGDGGVGLRCEVVAVVAEEDVLHVGMELGVGAGGVAGVSRSGWHLRHADRHTNVGLGSAAVVLGDVVVVGGAGGRDGLGAVDRNFTNAVDADAGGIRATPVEDHGLTEIDGERVGRDGRRGRQHGGCGGGHGRGRRGRRLLAAAGGSE